MSQKLKELEKKIGYTFQDLEILKQAMMHSSYTVSYTHLDVYKRQKEDAFVSASSFDG